MTSEEKTTEKQMENEPGTNTQARLLDWNDVMITIVKANNRIHELGLDDTQLGAIVRELTTIGTTFKEFYDGQSIKGAGRTILKCLVGEVVDIRFASVVLMAQQMDSRMKEYDHWSGWSDMDLDSLTSRMLKNISGILGTRYDRNIPEESEEEYDASVRQYIRDQSADIANFAMMISVNFGELGDKQMTEPNVENTNQVNEVHDKTAAELQEAQLKADMETQEQDASIAALTETIRGLSPETLRNLRIALATYPGDVHEKWEPSPEVPLRPSSPEPEVPYENTWMRLENMEALVHDIITRLDPVLAGPDTVVPPPNQDTITQIDSKLASIMSDLYNLYHRIQL